MSENLVRKTGEKAERYREGTRGSITVSREEPGSQCCRCHCQLKQRVKEYIAFLSTQSNAHSHQELGCCSLQQGMMEQGRGLQDFA